VTCPDPRDEDPLFKGENTIMCNNGLLSLRSESLQHVTGGASARVPADPNHLPATRAACNGVIGGMWKASKDSDGVRRPYCLIDSSTDVPSLR
jgi:hypothetical protein